MYRRIRELREDNDYECGDVHIPTDILIKLAGFYQVSVDDLPGRTNKREWNQ